MRNRHSNGTPIITFLTRRSTAKGMIVVSVIVAYGLVYPFWDSAGILYTIPVLLTAWFFWVAGGPNRCLLVLPVELGNCAHTY